MSFKVDALSIKLKAANNFSATMSPKTFFACLLSLHSFLVLLFPYPMIIIILTLFTFVNEIITKKVIIFNGISVL